MEGIIKKLYDDTGAIVFPVTHEKSIYMEDGKTLKANFDSVNAQLADIVTYPIKYGGKGDGINDDTTPFQNALDNCAIGSVVDLEGKHYAVKGITINKRLHLKNGSITLLSNATKSAIEVASAVNGAELSDLKIYINKTTLTLSDASGIFVNGATDITIRNCYVDGSKNNNYDSPHMHSCIYAFNADGLQVIDCIVENADKEGIMTNNCNNVTLQNCKGLNCGYSGIGTSYGDGLIANDCYSEGCGASGLSFNTANATISNPTVKNNLAQNGLTVGHAIAGAYAENCTIVNPFIIGAALHGVSINYSKNCNIIGGNISGCGGNGINVIPRSDEVGVTNISDVVIDDCTNTGINVSCNALPGNVLTNINGCIIKNCTDGITVVSNGDTNIEGNTIRNINLGVHVTGTDDGAVRIGTMLSARIEHNKVFSSITHAYEVYNLLECIFRHNEAVSTGMNVLNTSGKIPGTSGDGASKIPMPNPFIITDNLAKTLSGDSYFAYVDTSTYDNDSKRLIYRDNTLINVATDKRLLFDTTHYTVESTDNINANMYLLNTNQTLANNVETKVGFNAKGYDTNNIADTVNSAFVCPMQGIYMIWGQVDFASNAVGNRSLFLYLNGSAYTDDGVVSAIGSDVLNFCVSLRLQAADIVTLNAYQSSGGNLAIRASSTARRTQIAIKRIGD